MKRLLFALNFLLAAAGASAQYYEDIAKALPYVRLNDRDSNLYYDPMSPDTFQYVPPGEVYALKGETSEVTTVFPDQHETKETWYEVRYAGKVELPSLPPPPYSRLPRYQDGWLAKTRCKPVGVSFSEAADDLNISLPFLESEELDGEQFFQFFEIKENALTADANKWYVDKTRFMLPFINGKKQIFGDSTIAEHKFTYAYLGQYVTANFYLLEVREGKNLRYDFVSRADGSLLASVQNPWSVPALSPDGKWVATTGGTSGQPINFIHFHRVREGSLREEFTIRTPFQRANDLDWETELSLLLRVRQDDPIETGAQPPEKYYRFNLELPEN